jgi:hypothetical protein
MSSRAKLSCAPRKVSSRHLSALMQSAADDAVDEDPAEQQTAEQLPLHAAHLADSAGDLQHSLAADTRTHKHNVKNICK